MDSSAWASDWRTQPARISIQVEHGAWGTASVTDIQKVLASVVAVLSPYFPRHASDRIVVESSREGPRVLFRKSSDDAYRVLLNVQDTRWDQFTYQFSHELCHIFTNFEHREVGRNAVSRDHQWFEETLCEAVSLFTLDRTASRWASSPPYPGGEEYAPAFREYAKRLLSETHRRLPPNESIAEWYRENQEDLKGNPYLREKNELLATWLLPLLENTPGSLEAIAYLNLENPASQKSFKAYLESWYSCCPGGQRAFIDQVIALFNKDNAGGRTTVALRPSYQTPY